MKNHVVAYPTIPIPMAGREWLKVSQAFHAWSDKQVKELSEVRMSFVMPDLATADLLLHRSESDEEILPNVGFRRLWSRTKEDHHIPASQRFAKPRATNSPGGAPNISQDGVRRKKGRIVAPIKKAR